MRHGQLIAIVLINTTAFDIPDEVTVDYVRHLRGLDKNRPVDRLDIGQNILCNSRIDVVIIHPDSRRRLNIGYNVFANKGSAV